MKNKKEKPYRHLKNSRSRLEWRVLRERGSGSKHLSLLISYSKRAYSKGMQCYLTEGDFKALELMNCVYCGGVPSGYDRIDSSIGYIRANIVPACATCNIMKYTHSRDKFINQIKKIYEYQFRRR